jgi:hypothetical protein
MKKKQIVIDFLVGSADNPKINAILLVEGGKENTHYDAYQKYVSELEKLRVSNYE